MNYLSEILAFYDWIENNQVSASCISLWGGLMYQANKTGWKPWFSVSISTLELRTGLKRGAIYTARNRLRQLGAIDFKERTGSQSSEYHMNSLCSFNEHNCDTTQSFNNLRSLNEHNPDTTQHTIATQPRHNPVHNPDHYINETKLNETKRKGITAAAGAREAVFGEAMGYYMDKIQAMPSATMTTEMQYFAEDIDADAIKRAIDIALDERKPNWSYIRGILNRWKSAGIKTLADAERERDEWQSRKNNQTARGDSSGNIFLDMAKEGGIIK